ncbi:GFA family protein [Motilimonas sp. 1_MG-2023]|uniref:GFA family protein n=1 Tax=Motilimonas sp. 1_MG-2023 TaxID=3062672 RepID=UPI0026E49413|nr:GFA family protein [Motilimonas sp. 1_MG-2023]MDO6526586.1 GFA family protein [Motilimonas sp. 1_MG-2023]
MSEKPSMMGICHCSRCRKVGASALAFVKSDTFTITAGKSKITTFKAEPPYQYDRCFCSVCGTSLGEILSKMESFPINANCIDSELDLEVKFHEFVSEKPNWLAIGDKAKQFIEHPHE